VMLLIKHFYSDDFQQFAYKKIELMLGSHQAKIGGDCSIPGRPEHMMALYDEPPAWNADLYEESKETNGRKMLAEAIKKLRGLMIDYESIQQHVTLEYIFEEGECFLSQFMNANGNVIEECIKGLNTQEIAIFRANWGKVTPKNNQTNHKLLWCFNPRFKREVDVAIKRVHKIALIMEKAFIAHLIRHFYSDVAEAFGYDRIGRMLQERCDEIARGNNNASFLAIKNKGNDPMDET
jgi:hypothetical protein